MTRDRSFDFVPEAAELLGHQLADINADPFALICPNERAAIHASISHHEAAGLGLVRDIVIERSAARASGALLVMIPLQSERGEPDVWDGLLQIRSRHDVNEGGAQDDAVERASRGSDLVAARALLGWSRQDLAEASRVSLSTIRRLEDGGHTSQGRSRTRILETLRQAGVRFQLTFDGMVTLSRRPTRPEGAGPRRDGGL